MGYSVGVSTVKTSTGGHIISNHVLRWHQHTVNILLLSCFCPSVHAWVHKKNKKPIVAPHILIYQINKQNGSRGIAPTKFKTFLCCLF